VMNSLSFQTRRPSRPLIDVTTCQEQVDCDFGIGFGRPIGGRPVPQAARVALKRSRGLRMKRPHSVLHSPWEATRAWASAAHRLWLCESFFH
jgi:hypothetical protein